MEGSMIDLSKYRFKSAKEDLETAQLLMKDGRFKASVNRSYYAIFHGLRSVTALADFDSSKHSGVIAFFNRTYVKEGQIKKTLYCKGGILHPHFRVDRKWKIRYNGGRITETR